MGLFIDLIGQKFGRLTVVERVSGASKWVCVCDCGKVTTPSSYNLRKGVVKSCGCFNREAVSTRNLTHGLRHTPEYDVWSSIVQRTTNRSNKRFSDYGGRGIDIDPRWLTFECFLADMGTRPSRKHSIERVDNDRGYGPENCKWVLPEVQNNNTRRNCTATFKGKTQTISQWCRELRLNYRTIKGRLVAYGWSIERALSTPTKSPFRGTNNEITY